jgi:hypothetical protein
MWLDSGMVLTEIDYREWAGESWYGIDDSVTSEHEHAVPFDEGKCAECEAYIGATLREDADGYEHGYFITMFLTDDGRYVCEDCADEMVQAGATYAP